MREIEKKAMARRLRKKLTPAEALMLWRLRRNFDGWRFRRQHPVGPYIADFACSEARLAIEIDGATHGTPEERAYDERRTRYLEAGPGGLCAARMMRSSETAKACVRRF